MILTLNPTTVVKSGLVSPSASGLSGCTGKSIIFKKGPCGSGTKVSSCTSGSMGCTGPSFRAPSTVGTYTYYACINKNSKNAYKDPGEQDSEVLTVVAATTTTTLLPTTTTTLANVTTTTTAMLATTTTTTTLANATTTTTMATTTTTIFSGVIQLTTSTKNQYNPRIDVNYVVYTGRAPVTDDEDIYLYNLANSLEMQITTSLPQKCTALESYTGSVIPDCPQFTWSAKQTESYVFGTKVVYTDYSHACYNGDPLTTTTTLANGSGVVATNWTPCPDIYMYDISTGQTIQVSSKNVEQRFPVMYGDKVVWREQRPGVSSIYMKDLSTGAETKVADGASQHIHGNLIVFIPNGAKSVAVYHIDTGITEYINVNSTATFPEVFRDIVVYQDYRFGGWNVFIYNLTSRTETRITTSSDMYNRMPHIHDNKIIYFTGGVNIYLYDLNKKTATFVLQTSGLVLESDIHGNKIVFQDAPYGNADIFLKYI